MNALTIFCDGACINNGKKNAKAGFGLYILSGKTELHRCSFRVPPSEMQTNQRAELRALLYALQFIDLNTPESEGGSKKHTETKCISVDPLAELAISKRRPIIYTDSQYGINCLTKWAPKWAAAGWKKADKSPIMHLDIIKTAIEIMRRIAVELEHVSAHTGGKDFKSVGNAVADELARAGVELHKS
jgi:ribonuclease HI